jgi:hypothetical protein
MRKFFGALVTSLMLVALTIVSVSAKAKAESATFQISEPVTVGGVVLDKGRYTFKFNEETSELSVNKDGENVATVKATVVEENRKFEDDNYTTKLTDAGRVLTGVRFGGERRTIVPADTK